MLIKNIGWDDSTQAEEAEVGTGIIEFTAKNDVGEVAEFLVQLTCCEKDSDCLIFINDEDTEHLSREDEAKYDEAFCISDMIKVAERFAEKYVEEESADVAKDFESNNSEVYENVGILFDTYLNSKGVHKYISNKGKVKIVAGGIQEQAYMTHDVIEKFGGVAFKDNESCEKWIDDVVGYDDASYNQVRALQTLIEAMQ